jgi:hypothetical protein
MAGSQTEPSLQELFPVWHRNQQWREELARKAAHKALDIPVDGMGISVAKNGMSAAGVAGIAAVAGLPALVMAGAMMFNGREQAKPAPQTEPAPTVIRRDSPAYEFDEIEQELQADGTWKDTGKRFRKRMNPDGTVAVRQADGTWK